MMQFLWREVSLVRGKRGYTNLYSHVRVNIESLVLALFMFSLDSGLRNDPFYLQVWTSSCFAQNTGSKGQF